MTANASRPGSERFVDRKRRERRDVIIRETAVVLAEQGCCSIRVEDIASRASVGKGTVYLDFGDKDDLIDETLKHVSGEIIALVEARIGPEEGIRGEVRALHEIARERPDLMRFIEHRVPCETRHTGTVPTVSLERYLTEKLRTSQQAGGFAGEADPAATAQVLVATIASPAWRERAEAEGPEKALALLGIALSELAGSS